VAPAETKDGNHVVLKISFPNNNEFPLEMKALEFYDGVGAIKILEEDVKMMLYCWKELIQVCEFGMSHLKRNKSLTCLIS